MEITLINNEQGVVVGYTITAKTKKEKKILDDIRGLHFFQETDGDKVLYDGMSVDEKTDLVKEMSFITKSAMISRDSKIKATETGFAKAKLENSIT